MGNGSDMRNKVGVLILSPRAHFQREVAVKADKKELLKVDPPWYIFLSQHSCPEIGTHLLTHTAYDSTCASAKVF